MGAIIDSIANFLGVVLSGLYGATGSYLVAIVVLTVLVKMVLHPLTRRQLKSMKDMQALTPQIEVLRRKYRGDPQQLNQEMMKLYRTSGVNPFGGCLPLIAQLPVLYGLFTLFRREGVFGGETLFGVPLATNLHWNMLADHPLLVLIPILTAVTTYFQQKVSITDPQQAQMFAIMPFFVAGTTVFGYFPIGLALYWIVSTAVYVIEYLIVVGPPKKIRVAPPRTQRSSRRGQEGQEG
jgi:YidC/Oxa1 family membrane protein insertase